MIRSELVAYVAEQNPHLYQRDVEALVGAILDLRVKALANGDRVELRDFGVLSTCLPQARSDRNPRTGAAIKGAARKNIHFRPSRTMQARLNPDDACPNQEPVVLQRAS